MAPVRRRRLRAGRQSLVLKALIVGVGIIVVSLALSACAPGGSTTGGGSQATPAQPQKCGTVVMVEGGRTVTDPAAARAESCFWQAYQHCQAATITTTMMGVDAGTIRTFTITPNGNNCVVKDSAQNYVVPKGKGPLMTYTCASLIQQKQGLLFKSCGDDGDITVPAPSA